MTGDGKLERYSTVLLAIYRAAREMPADQFQDAAMRLLKPILRFDSSMWGSGTLSASGMAVHSIHLSDRTFAQEVRRESHVAIVDMRGKIHTADVGFDEVLRREWSAWEGENLPELLVAALTASPDAAFRGGRIVVNARRMRDLLFLHARPLNAVDQLTPRESEVAKRFGAGQSYKEVARALGISPSTVRNHLQVIYDKLDVNDKTALARLVATKS